jgi:hypothetical protein
LFAATKKPGRLPPAPACGCDVIAFPALTPLPGQTADKTEPEVKEKVAEEIE